MIPEAVVPGKADTVSLQEVLRLGEKMYQEGDFLREKVHTAAGMVIARFSME
jgi:hypothetical protein